MRDERSVEVKGAKTNGVNWIEIFVINQLILLKLIILRVKLL